VAARNDRFHLLHPLSKAQIEWPGVRLRPLSVNPSITVS
jgi:hypothetical protein